ncbi:hypothetical protein DID80_01710 [Candidatus Marinamargulisbacteria bacterium SCGC AAA071-K20]|nr:hypothetical protein DID80_01710 [Candidatus Marinamargulisbacteria bacterium SCGC AAA071-K20]
MYTITCPIYDLSKSTPNHVAVELDNKKVTYFQLNRLINTISNQLLEKNVQKGSVIIITSNDYYFSLVCTWALFRLGAIAFSLNHRFSDKIIYSYFQETKALCVLSNEENRYKQQFKLSFDSVSTLTDDPVPRLSLNQIATYLLTSGSTGTSKIAVHSFGSFYSNARLSTTFMGLNNESKYLFNLPMYHVSGLSIVFRALLNAATLLFSTNKNVSKLIETAQVTHLSLVETQLLRLLEDKKANYTFLKAVLLGGSSISQGTIDKALERKLPILQSYGLTEASSQVFTKNLQTHSTIFTCEIKIENKQISIKGVPLFLGYYENGLITLPLDEDGYFRTKDLGELSQESHLKVNGRADNCFISGGENISPEEIEMHMLKLPGIKKVIVVPRKDAKFQYCPVAFVDSDELNPTNTQSWKTLLLKDMPNYKIPKEIFPWPTLTDSTRSKINRSDFSKLIS